MPTHSEHLHNTEHLTANEERGQRGRPRLERTVVEQVLLQQAEMLLAIEHDISPAVYETLYAKIEREHAFLLARIASSTQEAQAATRRSRTLTAEYFTQKHFDSNLI